MNPAATPMMTSHARPQRQANLLQISGRRGRHKKQRFLLLLWQE
jgi:hypothetical protein